MFGTEADPYIGVTGITSPEQAYYLLGKLPKDFSRVLMIGVLVGSKLLRGEKNKYWRQFPDSVSAIANIFPHDPRALNLIHFHNDPEDRHLLTEQMKRLAEVGGDSMAGFQLNIPWPQTNYLYKYLDEFPNKARIVLQIGEKAMFAVDNSPDILINRLGNYEDVVTDILIDPSGGFGKSFDPVRASELLTAVTETYPDIGIGVAGGLGKDRLSVLKDLFMKFPQLSIDAQGRLRDEVDFGGKLQLDDAVKYIEQASVMVKSNKSF